MVKIKIILFICLLTAITTVFCGFDQGYAQPSKVEQGQTELSKHKSTQNSARLRRQEAKKRLKEAIEARKADRLAPPGQAAPEKYAKGVQNE